MSSQLRPIAALLLSLLTLLVQTVPVAAQADPASRTWLSQMFASYDSGAAFQPMNAPTPTAQSLATWDWLRRTPSSVEASPPLAAQARFITGHAGWPGLAAIRRRAEAQAADPLTADADARAFFQAVAPQTANGQARFALVSAGPQAAELARAAWTRTGMTPELEAAIDARFGAGFSRADHAKRADALLWAGQTSAAGRLLDRLDDPQRALTQARIGLRTGAGDAEGRVASVPASLRRDAGLTYDRALWLERKGRLSEAEALLGRGDIEPGSVTAPEVWLEKRLALGRAAMRRGDGQTAVRLLGNHKTFAPATNIATLPLSQRIDLSDTEWLAGWVALRKLNRPEEAVRYFTNFNASVTTPISRSRGDYWLGRAEKARGNQAAARVAFDRAAQHFDYYYGQLAAEEMGRLPELPPVSTVVPTDADKAKFEQSSLRKAVVLLNSMGSRERESLFVRALAESSATPGEARLAADMGAAIGRQDLGVWTWKTARPRGDMGTFDKAFPRLPPTASVPSREWIISHAIARQESSFDRTALSSAGARGLMQLMPATARDVATKLGMPYDGERLFTDPAYNISFGSYYIGLRRDNFSNAMMAIAAYNAGAGNVRKWINANGDPRGSQNVADYIDWVEMIPISETRTYVQRVTENAVVYSLLEPKRQGANPRASGWLKGP